MIPETQTINHQTNIQTYRPQENRRSMARMGLFILAPMLFFAFLLTLTNLLSGLMRDDLLAGMIILIVLPVGATALAYISFDILYREHLTISEEGITFRFSLNERHVTWEDVLRFGWDESLDTPAWGLLVVRAGLSPARNTRAIRDRFYVVPLARFEDIPINRSMRDIDMAQFRYMPLGQTIFAHKPHLFDGVPDLAHPQHNL